MGVGGGVGDVSALNEDEEDRLFRRAFINWNPSGTHCFYSLWLCALERF